MHTVRIQTISLGSNTRLNLALMHKAFDEAAGPIRIDFGSCVFIKPAGVALLGALIARQRQNGETVVIDWDTATDAVHANLIQNGFKRAFGGSDEPWTGNSVPYLHHEKADHRNFVQYLENHWLGRNWVNLESAPEIISSIVEIYNNAFDHSMSTHGVFCCGQRFPAKKILSLSLLDLGVGIPARVRKHFGAPTIEASRCLRWAFQPGTTTREGRPGGLGLDTLSRFVVANRGSLQLYSNEGEATLYEVTKYADRADGFKGTMANVHFRCS